ncbi:MAG: hypothetical protein EBQ96_00775 [Proteobacteria bacterium]|nr:hypothetical protein [Pseudomonadota bacterium]
MARTVETRTVDLINQELDRGVISQDFLEYFSINTVLDGKVQKFDTPQQKGFEGYMQMLANRIMESKFAKDHMVGDVPPPQFRFMVMDHHIATHMIYEHPTSPVIILTKPLLERIREAGSEDFLAALIAKNLATFFFGEKSGRRNTTKLEAAFTDAAPTFLLHYAGYRYDMAEHLVSICDPLPYEDKLNRMRMDTHINVSDSFRERVVEDSYALLSQYLKRRRQNHAGLQARETTSIDELVIDEALKFEFYHGNELTVLGREEYLKKHAQKAIEDPAGFIMDLVKLVNEFNVPEEKKLTGYAKRIPTSSFAGEVSRLMYGVAKLGGPGMDDIMPLYEAVQKKFGDGTSIITPFLMASKSKAREDASEFFSAKAHFGESAMVPTVGNYGALKRSLDEIYAQLDADDIDQNDMQQKCRAFSEALADMGENATVLRYFKFSLFKGNFPTVLGKDPENDLYARWVQRMEAMDRGEEPVEGFTPPWEKMVAMAKQEYAEAGTTYITEVLMTLGIRDPRLRVENNAAENTPSQKMGITLFKLSPPHLVQDEQGKMIGSYQFPSFYAGRLMPDYKKEIIYHDELAEDVSAKKIACFKTAERAMARTIEDANASIYGHIEAIQSPDDVYKLFKLYPLLFVLNPVYEGGEIDPETGLPEGSKAIGKLLEKMSGFLAEDPKKWAPVLEVLFFEKNYLGYRDIYLPLKENPVFETEQQKKYKDSIDKVVEAKKHLEDLREQKKRYQSENRKTSNLDFLGILKKSAADASDTEVDPEITRFDQEIEQAHEAWLASYEDYKEALKQIEESFSGQYGRTFQDADNVAKSMWESIYHNQTRGLWYTAFFHRASGFDEIAALPIFNPAYYDENKPGYAKAVARIPRMLKKARREFEQHGTVTLPDGTSMGKLDKVMVIQDDSLGLHPKHPAIQFVLRYTEGMATNGDPVLFTVSQALNYIDRVSTSNSHDSSGRKLPEPEIQLTDIYFTLAGLNGYARDEADLGKRLNKLKHIVPSFLVNALGDENDEDKSYFRASKNWKSSFMFTHAKFEAYNFLKRNPDVILSNETLRLVHELATIDARYSGEYAISNKDFKEEIQEKLKHQVRIRANHDFAQPDHDPDVLADTYVFMGRSSVFQYYPDIMWGDDRKGGYNKLVSVALEKLTSAPGNYQDVRRFTERILFGTTVHDPKLRKSLIKAWAESVKHEHGIDPMSAFASLKLEPQHEAYVENVLEVGNHLIKNLGSSSALLLEITEAMMEELETQKTATDAVVQNLRERALKDLSEADILSLAGFHMDSLVKDENLRGETLDFLRGDLTDESLEKYIDAIRLRQEQAEVYNSKHDNNPFKRDENFDAIELYYGISKTKLNLSLPEDRKRLAAMLSSAHENFWQSSVMVRTYYISQLAFPDKNRIRHVKRNPPFNELMQRCIDSLLPFEYEFNIQRGHVRKDSEYNEYVDIARDLIYSYMDEALISEKRLLLSAALVSSKSMGENSERSLDRIGQALATVLSNLGPAGAKMAQAVHSFPNLPDEMRRGMGNVKGEFSPPTRKQRIDRLSEVIPKTTANDDTPVTQRQVRHIGRGMGAGSYQVTTRVQLKKQINGIDDVAFTHLRSHVATHAKNEFGHFFRSVNRFIARRADKGKPVTPSAIKGIVSSMGQALGMVDIEVNYDTGKNQSDMMEERYDGMVIEVDGRKVAFTTVDWLGHYTKTVKVGDEEDVLAFKMAAIAPGMGFNRWVDTQKEAGANGASVKIVSAAADTAENILKLHGSHSDDDRHGENFHVYEVRENIDLGSVKLKAGDFIVSIYDLGAVNLEQPTADQKARMGEAVIKSFSGESDPQKALLSGLNDAISDDVDQIEELKITPGGNYFAATLRGMLARNDFARELSPDDRMQAFMTAFQAGVTDPDILRGAKSGMGQTGGAVAGMLMSSWGATAMKLFSGSRSGISIKVHSLPGALRRGNEVKLGQISKPRGLSGGA